MQIPETTNVPLEIDTVRDEMIFRPTQRWRSPLYAVAFVDFVCSLLIFFTLLRWDAPDYSIPSMYLYLYIFQLPHVLSALSLVRQF